jgi:hypothetical protein
MMRETEMALFPSGDDEMVCDWCGNSIKDCLASQSGETITMVTRKEFEEGPDDDDRFPDWDTKGGE